MNKIYTGRKVAIFTDAHGLLEPVKAALKDIKSNGITEIYSLGDNIGNGPDSLGVIKALALNGVKSIAGNAEEYIRLGLEPFASYMMREDRIRDVKRTKEQLGSEGVELVHQMSHSYVLKIGGKKIGLCHFGNDVRIDYWNRSTWTYQTYFDYLKTGVRYDENASKQFSYTASEEQINEIRKLGTGKNSIKKENLGFKSAYEEPMFPREDNPHIGHKLEVFDDIFQGHVHFKLEDPGKTNYHSLRAIGMAYRKDPIDTASYVILDEYIDTDTNEQGFDIKEILVKYDREKMVYKILNEMDESFRLEKFTNVTEEEKKKLRR